MTKIKTFKKFLIFGIFGLAVIAGSFAFIHNSFAAVKTWDGGGTDNLFSTPENWSGDTVPVNGDSLVFNVASLTGNETLTNDINNLSLVGITFTGYNNDYKYTIDGNDFSISGTILNEQTVDPGNNMYSNVFTDIDITLTGDTTLVGVSLENVNTQGYELTLTGRSFGPSSCGGEVMLGNISGTGSIIVSDEQAIFDGDNSGFTGSIIVDQDAFLRTGVTGINSASSVMVNDGTLFLQRVDNSQTIDTDVSISGTLRVASGATYLCSGDSFTAPDGSTLNFDGDFQLNGDLTFKSGSLAGNASTDSHVDFTTVTGTHASNGHNVTLDADSRGDFDLPADAIPGPPTDLTATPADTEVDLDWTAPTNDGGSPITDYVVEYKLSSGSTWNTVSDGTSTTPSATVTGLTNATNYDFRVQAVNAVGAGPQVTITNIQPTASATAPGAPTNLTAEVSSENNNLILNWTAPASNGGSPITDYQIQARYTGSPSWSTVSHAPFTGTTIEIYSGLSAGETYDFQVSAVNAIGTGSPVQLLAYTYNPTGTDPNDDLDNAGGVGGGVTTGTPNTGGALLSLANPIVVAISGILAAGLVMSLVFIRKNR